MAGEVSEVPSVRAIEKDPFHVPIAVEWYLPTKLVSQPKPG